MSSKRIELSGAPSTAVGQTHSPGTVHNSWKQLPKMWG